MTDGGGFGDGRFLGVKVEWDAGVEGEAFAQDFGGGVAVAVAADGAQADGQDMAQVAPCYPRRAFVDKEGADRRAARRFRRNAPLSQNSTFKIQNLPRSLRVTSHLVPPESRSAEEDLSP